MNRDKLVLRARAQATDIDRWTQARRAKEPQDTGSRDLYWHQTGRLFTLFYGQSTLELLRGLVDAGAIDPPALMPRLRLICSMK